MSRLQGALLFLLVALAWPEHMQGQTDALSQSASTMATTPQEDPVAHYFKDYWASLRLDWRTLKRTCDNARQGDHNPKVSKYVRFNQWVACGQDVADGNAYAIDFGMAPAGNGVRLGLKLKDNKALQQNLDSNLEFDGNDSYNGTWTTYGYWSLRPHWFSKTDFLKHEDDPFFRIFGGSQKIQLLPYYGEGEQTQVSSMSYYALQRTPVAVRVDFPIVLHPDKQHRNRQIALTPTVQLGGHWYGLADASSPGISTVNVGLGTNLLATPKYFEQAVGFSIVPSTYGAGHLEQNDTVAMVVSNHHAVGIGGYSFRQFTGNWSHNFIFNCDKWEVPISTGGSAMVTESHCFELDLNGGVTASATDAGNTIPFFLQPTVGGSDIGGILTVPSYADYRFRGPDAEYGTATLRYPLYRVLHKLALPLELEARTDTGKASLRRDGLSIDHMRHSYSVGFALKVGGIPAVDFFYSWGGKEGSRPHALLNPEILGSPLTGFW
jgi:hypothetical protein